MQGLIATAQPVDVWAWAAGTSFALLALALWIASYRADRLALRLFALRYGVAAVGWFFIYPRQVASGTVLAFPAVLMGLALIVITLVALDLYLGRFRWRGLLLYAGLGLVAAMGLRWNADVAPNDPRALFAVFAAGMAWCSAHAFMAARRERNSGHLLIALAFLFYPLVVLTAALRLVPVALADLTYLVAVPGAVAGLAVLLASLIRSARRLEAELRRREAAERRVQELNASLEARVRERTADLSAVVEGLEAFTRNVSHDLRGPLAGIAGVARLAERALVAGDTQRVAQLLAPVAPQADQLGSMVQDLLRLSKVTQGECQRKLQPLRPVLDAAIEQLALASDFGRLPPEVALDLGALPDARVDAALMKQVFVNLLANAMRFALNAAQHPRVRVGAERHNGQVTFYVADNGPGIPVGREAELFRPFSRLHAAGLSQNGIGLSIVQQIIAKHHGRIWAERNPGGGAVFRFELG